MTSAAAHTGSYGARLTYTSGQYAVTVKSLAQPVADSSVSFWARVSPGGGVQTLRRRAIGAPANSSRRWSMTAGKYARNTNLQVVQLWNDSTSTTDFDDVQVTIRGPYAPAAPTGGQGTAHDSSVALSWTAPASGGGSPITNYQITKYVNGTALAPIRLNSASPNYTVAGLVNGSAYAFTVAAINAVGTSPDSGPSAPITPVVATTPGAPTAVQATPSNGGATVSWTAPASDGGSPITSYQIVPFMNGTAQTAIVTPANPTRQNIGGLTNGASTPSRSLPSTPSEQDRSPAPLPR
jgi:hypothetical protein